MTMTTQLIPPAACLRGTITARVLVQLLAVTAIVGCGLPMGATQDPQVGTVASALELPAPRRWIGIDGSVGCPVADPNDQCVPNVPPPLVNPDLVPCPAAVGWTASRLFSYTPPGRMTPVPLPPYLLRYCLYEWNGQGPADPNGPGGDLAELHYPSSDRAVMAGHSLGTLSLLRPWQRTHFRNGARDFGTLPAGQAATIEIALLDTSPDSPAGAAIPRGSNDHGYVLGWTASDLTSDAGGPALASISSVLTMPYKDESTIDRANGGDFGGRGDVAHSVMVAVENWKVNALARPRLAMTMAFGWPASIGAANEASSRAVHDAMVHAACHGAFMAAAAGNDTGGPMPASGQLYPAAWESENGPDGLRCAALGDAPSIPNYPYIIFPAPAAPLVVSMGGLDYSDSPISITRPESLTKLATLAFQTVAGSNQQHTPLAHTGTSVAAAVTASAAAAIWAYNPKLTAPDVFNLLMASSQPTAPVPSSLCVGNSCSVARLSMCEALDLACPLCGFVCSHSRSGNANAGWSGALQTALALDFPAPGPAAVPVLPSAVPWKVLESTAKGPWAQPQPTRPGCDVCGFMASTGVLHIAWSLTYTIDVFDMVLTLNGNDYAISPLVHPGDIISTTITPGAATSAWLSWKIDAMNSASEEISIVEP